MQPIERYGVITLLLLVLTIFAVALWDDGAAQGPEDQVAAKTETRSQAGSQDEARKAAEAKRAQEARRKESALARQRERQAEQRRQAEAAQAAQRPSPSEVSVGGTSSRPGPGQPQALPDFEPSGGTGSSAVALLEDLRARPEGDRGSARRETAQSQARKRKQRELLAQKQAASRATQNGSLGGPELARRQEEEAPKAVPASLGSGREIKVASGDSLSALASRHLGSAQRWKELAQLNGITNPSSLRVGQVLKLPEGASGGGSTSFQRPASPSQGTSATSGSSTYTVRPGDVLSSIAQRELGGASRWKDIVAANPGLDPNRLKVGAKLVMPAGRSRTRSAPTADRTSRARVVGLTPPSARRTKSKVQ